MYAEATHSLRLSFAFSRSSTTHISSLICQLRKGLGCSSCSISAPDPGSCILDTRTLIVE